MVRMTLLCTRSAAATTDRAEARPRGATPGWRSERAAARSYFVIENVNSVPTLMLEKLPKILFIFRDLIVNLPVLIIKIVKMIIRKFSQRSTFTNCQQLFLL